MTCSMSKCIESIHCKRLCKRHYQQQWRTGDAEIVRPNRHGTPEERFWAKVPTRNPGECWEWYGRKDDDGYGSLRIGNTSVRAHRFAFELAHGVTDGLIRHRCDNPGCVNAEHLLSGDHQDNMDDRMAAGNYVYATCRRGHKWTEASMAWQGPERNHRTCKICRRMTPAERKAFDLEGLPAAS